MSQRSEEFGEKKPVKSKKKIQYPRLVQKERGKGTKKKDLGVDRDPPRVFSCVKRPSDVVSVVETLVSPVVSLQQPLASVRTEAHRVRES